MKTSKGAHPDRRSDEPRKALDYYGEEIGRAHV